MFDFNIEITGNVLGDDTGEMTLVAYKGEINSLDFDINTDDIAGFANITKEAGDTFYTLPIMKIGNPLPIDNVFIFGFIDKNTNGMLILKHNHNIIDLVAWEGLWSIEAKEGQILKRQQADINEMAWVVI